MTTTRTAKTTAIVLRVVEFSETSLVVTLMTRDFGKITALAKGARRKNSAFEAALDVLSICRIVFLHKTSDALDLLTEAKLERRFRCASYDLQRLYAGYYVVELLAALTDDADPHPELFDLAVETMQQLDDVNQRRDFSDVNDQDGVDDANNHYKKINSEATNPQIGVLQFELRAMEILGHRPMIENCVGCGRRKTDANLGVDFGLRVGGILCQKCRPGNTSVINLSAEAWQLIRRWQATDKKANELNLPSEPKFEQKTLVELRQLFNLFIAHHLGYRPRLQKYISTEP
jgi:DNA repair protein RecO (recombination protein O)